MMTRTVKRALAGACALTLLLAACGDDEGDASSDEGTEETTESTEAPEESTESTEAPAESTESTEAPDESTSEPEGDPEAVATAESVNLKLEDFAEGWTESEPTDDEAEPDPIDECFTTADIQGTRLGEAEAPAFEVVADEATNAGQAIQMKTAVFDSPESATAVVDEVGGQPFADCLVEFITTQVLEGIEAQLAPVVDDPPVGEQSAGVAGAISIEGGDGSEPSQGLVDMHVIRTGPIVSFTLTIDSLGDQTFQQTLTELYTVIAERQATAAA